MTLDLGIWNFQRKLVPVPSYAAFLGHQPHVSLAELRAAIPAFHLQRMIGSVALFDTTKELLPSLLLSLGGTVLLAEENPERSPSLQKVPDILRNAVASVKGKVTFGLRCIGLPSGRIRTLYRECKDSLQHTGRHCRYIGNDRQPAHTALLRDSGVLDGRHGIELVLLVEDEHLWCGKTIAAQNPTSYAQRDIGKPARDLRAGILPPKLAQMMLNLGEWLLREQRSHPLPPHPHPNPNPLLPLRSASYGGQAWGEGIIVLDPFSGSGVIPVECLLRGWMVIASDSSQKAVDACKRNIDWLRRTFTIPAAKIPSSVSKHNALKPFDFSHIRDERLRPGPTFIVTETSLGPSLRTRPPAQEAKKLRTENESLQIAFLRTVTSSIPGIPIVCTWPVWYLRTGPLFLEKVWKEIEHIGLEAVLPPDTPPSSPLRPTLLYRRPDQYVGREIVLLRSRK